jgi:phosphate transport system permease protein
MIMKRGRLFRLILTAIALVIPAALIVIVAFLARYSWTAIGYNGVRFLGTISWNLGNLYMNPVVRHGYHVPLGANYGILAFIVGTLFSSLLAILFALPVSIGTAVFLAEAVPRQVRPGFAMLVELVAVVPSVVFGLWGIYVLIPLIAHVFAPAITAVLGFIPFFNMGNSSGSGYGLLAAGIVLALMITPIIATTLYDALLQVPPELRESAVALGATRFEVVTKTLLPTVRLTLIGSVVLALGRGAELSAEHDLHPDHHHGGLHPLPARQRPAGPDQHGGGIARRDRAGAVRHHAAGERLGADHRQGRRACPRRLRRGWPLAPALGARRWRRGGMPSARRAGCYAALPSCWSRCR